MGGAWVDWPAADDPDREVRFRQMTNVPGCFVVGESEFEYHGANRLGANSLVACIFAGLVAGNEIPRYLETLKTSYGNVSTKIYSEAVSKEEALKHDLLTRQGSENVHRLHEELSDWMIRNMTVRRNNKDLKQTLEHLKELRERYQHITLDDHGSHMNQTYVFANQFGAMLELALAMTKGALMRDESRGSHFKEAFPLRDDVHWLKTTMAEYDLEEPRIFYHKVDTRHMTPVPRDYVHAKKINPHLENVPANIQLPL
jgi:succinate dehydrogenase / fumarate reductase flavoprotein subunit